MQSSRTDTTEHDRKRIGPTGSRPRPSRRAVLGALAGSAAAALASPALACETRTKNGLLASLFADHKFVPPPPGNLARVPAMVRPPRPLPGLPAAEELPHLELDVEATLAKRQMVVKGHAGWNRNTWGRGYDHGVVLMVPPVELPSLIFKTTISTQWVDGAMLYLRGIVAGGKRPVVVGDRESAGGAIAITNQRRIFMGVDIENIDVEGIDIHGGASKHTVDPRFVDYVRLARMRLRGRRQGNGLFIVTYPTTLVMEEVEVLGGGGDGLHHGVYLNGIARAEIRNCQFHSPHVEGHVFKSYARETLFVGNLVATALTEADLATGRTGGLPPMDIGGYGNATIAFNRIVRSGGARAPMIDFRNRHHRMGTKWGAPKHMPVWNTPIPDYRQIDNRNEADPNLFRQLIAFNDLWNGVMPDRTADPAAAVKPGYVVRNNSAVAYLYNRSPERFTVLDRKGRRRLPDWWRNHYDPCVVYLHDNRCYGVPFSTLSPGHVYRRLLMPTAVREIAALPDWAQARLAPLA